jgi:hypothetical protein
MSGAAAFGGIDLAQADGNPPAAGIFTTGRLSSSQIDPDRRRKVRRMTAATERKAHDRSEGIPAAPAGGDPARPVQLGDSAAAF